MASDGLANTSTSGGTSVRAATDSVASVAPPFIHNTVPPPERAPIADAINTTRNSAKKTAAGC